MSLSLSVCSQSGSPICTLFCKVQISYTTLQLVKTQSIGVATFFSFFLEPGIKLDEKSIEGQKFLVVCLFWGGCHHPNLLLLNTFQ